MSYTSLKLTIHLLAIAEVKRGPKAATIHLQERERERVGGGGKSFCRGQMIYFDHVYIEQFFK